MAHQTQSIIRIQSKLRYPIPQGWTYLGSGSFNHAFRSADGKTVLKIPQVAKEAADQPERAVRLWNMVNPKFPAKKHTTKEGYQGWICPFIKGEQAPDQEISRALIDIYTRTGRVVVDAGVEKNFLKTPKNEIVCVDVGFMIELDKRDNRHFRQQVRRNSTVSLEFWEEQRRQINGMKDSAHFGISKLDRWYQHRPLAVDTTRALMFIKEHRPDIGDVSFLHGNPKLITRLADAYCLENETTYRQETMNVNHDDYIRDSLNLLDTSHLSDVQKQCERVLLEYVNSRGSIHKDTGRFQCSFSFFRSSKLSTQKGNAATQLITNIRQATTLEGIQVLLKSVTEDLFAAKYTTSQFKVAIAKCELAVKSAIVHAAPEAAMVHKNP